MTSNVQNRQDIREAYADLLVTEFEGDGKPSKPAQKVYPYLVGDFRGRFSIMSLDSRPSTRSKQAQVTRVASGIGMDLHVLVLYAAEPVRATNNPTAGSNKVFEMDDTSLFSVGDEVFIRDDDHEEMATVTVVADGVSITVATLENSYSDTVRKPDVYWWSEKHAQNRLDLFEKRISDLNMDNDTTDDWDLLSLDGKPTRDDVSIGGKEYLHEIYHLQFDLKSD